MELQEAKDAVLQLMKEKDKIEDDLRVLKEILDCVRILCMILFPTEPNVIIVRIVSSSMTCQISPYILFA